MKRVSIVETEFTFRMSTESEKKTWKMRSESVNIHQENENSDVRLMLHEEEVLSICEEILEYQNNESDNEIEQDQVFLMNQTPIIKK